MRLIAPVFQSLRHFKDQDFFVTLVNWEGKWAFWEIESKLILTEVKWWK